jgi:hypothetical protein
MIQVEKAKNYHLKGKSDYQRLLVYLLSQFLSYALSRIIPLANLM